MNNAFEEYCLANDIGSYIQIVLQLLKNEVQVPNASSFISERIHHVVHLLRVKRPRFFKTGLKSLYLYRQFENVSSM